MLNWLNLITQGHAVEAVAVLAVVVVMRVVVSLIITSISKKKGYGELSIFFVCLVFGLCGSVIVAALPDKRLHEALARLQDMSVETVVSENNGILPKREAFAQPTGSVAYKTPAASNTESLQDQAVEKVKEYWIAADKREMERSDKKKRA